VVLVASSTQSCWLGSPEPTFWGQQDRCWLMPLYDEYRDLLKSEVADMVNTAGRYGGAMGAAMRKLEAGDIDVAIGRAAWSGRRPSRAIRVRPLRFEPLALMLPNSHPLAEMDTVPVAALAGVEIDANAATPEALEWLDLGGQFLAFAAATATPPHDPALGLDNQSDHLVRQGLPILTSIDHVEVPGGVVRQIVEPRALYPWSVAWLSKAGRDVVAAIDAAVEALTADGDWLELPNGAWLPEPEASERGRP
jgi:DNA-binding transcriptional LysR family regulator